MVDLGEQRYLERRVIELTRDSPGSVSSLSIGLNIPPSRIQEVVQGLVSEERLYKIEPNKYSSIQPETK